MPYAHFKTSKTSQKPSKTRNYIQVITVLAVTGVFFSCTSKHLTQVNLDPGICVGWLPGCLEDLIPSSSCGGQASRSEAMVWTACGSIQSIEIHSRENV